jgi:hypothetical protein
VLLTIRSQYNALDYVSSLVRDGGDELNVTTIRRLHLLITRHQATYEARNDLGQIMQAPLRHGEWKLHPNHVRRADGTLLEYTPPEQVRLADETHGRIAAYLDGQRRELANSLREVDPAGRVSAGRKSKTSCAGCCLRPRSTS